jgi:hypothetical protein
MAKRSCLIFFDDRKMQLFCIGSLSYIIVYFYVGSTSALIINFDFQQTSAPCRNGRNFKNTSPLFVSELHWP